MPNNLLTEANFRGDIAVAGTETSWGCEDLSRFIREYEPIFFDKAFGVDFANLFYAEVGASTPDARWDIFTNGGVWSDGVRSRRINGATYCASRYVYFYYLRNLATVSTPSGEKKTQTDNSIDTTPAWKQSFAWNQMLRDLRQMWYMLQNYELSSTLVFPEFATSYPTFSSFRPVNAMGI